ncbi:hypothetical protein CSH63_05305 [Micromonospora tulbaghiae]|uniref:Uncharacterized protein n=1 Tax=Micromonospora tulbaghiae TaxID=479978 RepID=A0A386WEP5_9ACTN|nr:hypothetical protein [Micromonospora tulbaghiae]AYF26876.1 hypothetical protein CSH63_05305 [Micromonospora tulbaghiae]
MLEMLAPTVDVPAPVLWAAVCIALLVIEHVFSLATPPYGLHVPFFFHLVSSGLYSWLGVQVWNGAGWASIVLTVLLGVQGVGRVFVWRAEDRAYAALVKTILAAGQAVTAVTLALLWIPESARQYLLG